MSNTVNTELLERAALMIDYFLGKMPAQVIEADIDRNDLEALNYHVTYAEAIASQEEIEAADIA